jgi:hypothetical protein
MSMSLSLALSKCLACRTYSGVTFAALVDQQLLQSPSSLPTFCGAAFHQSSAIVSMICKIRFIVDQETEDRDFALRMLLHKTVVLSLSLY